MARTAKQDRAIAWYVEENNLRLMATSAYPNYEFRSKDTGEVVSVHIVSLTDAYEGREKQRKRKEREAI